VSATERDAPPVAPPDEDLLARIALARLVEPGRWALHAHASARGAAWLLAQLLSGSPLQGVGAQTQETVRARVAGRDVLADAAADHATADRCGVRALRPGDPEWPARLDWQQSSDVPAPPLLLFVRGSGSLAELADRAVAVVGARAASSYGEHVARSLGIELADRGSTVVSGAAFGIDAAAHRGALSARGGRTIAVLACGLDVAYPAAHERLLQQVVQRGLVVSEQVCGARPTRAAFLVRNRLIAALSQGTVVVEAALRSGSLSTAHQALAMGRHVMAVPGPVTSAASAGCHQLIRRSAATLVTGFADVLELVSPVGEFLPEPQRGAERLRDSLSRSLRQVLDALPVRGGMGVAEVAQVAGVPVQTVLQALPPLEIAGLVSHGDAGWVLSPLGAGQ
jgi:DNA processing protein